jgi:hypothetical protein
MMAPMLGNSLSGASTPATAYTRTESNGNDGAAPALDSEALSDRNTPEPIAIVGMGKHVFFVLNLQIFPCLEQPH